MLTLEEKSSFATIVATIFYSQATLATKNQPNNK
jgi:hypothetical protein